MSWTRSIVSSPSGIISFKRGTIASMRFSDSITSISTGRSAEKSTGARTANVSARAESLDALEHRRSVKTVSLQLFDHGHVERPPFEAFAFTQKDAKERSGLRLHAILGLRTRVREVPWKRFVTAN